jgi:hypothetical protein
MRTHMGEDDYITLLKQKFKEYEHFDPKSQKLCYERDIWIRGGKTGRFVSPDDFWAGDFDEEIEAGGEDAWF